MNIDHIRTALGPYYQSLFYIGVGVSISVLLPWWFCWIVCFIYIMNLYSSHLQEIFNLTTLFQKLQTPKSAHTKSHEMGSQPLGYTPPVAFFDPNKPLNTSVTYA